MKRDYKLFINDIRESVFLIEQYLKDINKEKFIKNKQLQDAVTRRLEIIGEAGRNIPRALKEKNKQVPWFKISQFRDLVIHSYFSTSPDRVWIAATKNLKLIKEGMKRILLV